MNPFESDDSAQEHIAATSTPRSTGERRPRTHAPAASATIDVVDPFAVDTEHEDGSSQSQSEPDAGESRSISQGDIAASSASMAESQQPREVNPANASQMLSSSVPTASQENSPPGSHAVNMKTLQAHVSDDEEEEDDDEVENATVRGDEESSLMGSASSSRSGRRTDSAAHGRRRRRSGAGEGIAETLSAFGRRIVRAAREFREEDAARHQHRQAGTGPIRLDASSLDAGTDASFQRRGRAVNYLSQREKALWMWANTENLDEFLREVYAYYTGKGIVCILLARVLNLLTVAFVIGFSTLLFGCVDYSAIRHDGNLSEIIVGHCVSRFSGFTLLLLIILGGVYGSQLISFGFGLNRLRTMHHFFEHLLEIPEADVQTIPWHQVVTRLSQLLSTHPIASLSTSDEGQSRQRIDVHEAANRLMRRENYLIALFNGDLLDLSVPLLGWGNPVLTRSLQWNLDYCLLGFLFDPNGNVRRPFLTDQHRQDLIAGLRRRFLFMAVANAIFAPFIVMYLLAYSFFRYFEEYHKNPAYLGSRQYTELARWKFREFNELPHHFRKRVHSSYPFAQRYLEQFPKERTAIVARFVSFIAGSFMAVLVLASVLDPDLFVHFEITPQRNTLFYIGVFGAILAGARAMVPDERVVFEPEVLLEAVIHHTHYCPEEWRGKFHSAEINAEFGKLYSLKVSIFFTEVLSVLLTPLVLFFSLPNCAAEIIDFFRDYTVHVDGLGHVCSFAVFDAVSHGEGEGDEDGSLDRSEPSAKGQPVPVAVPSPVPDKDQRKPSNSRSRSRFGSSSRIRARDEAKMERSAINFAVTNEWQPHDPASSLYLSRLQSQYHQQQGLHDGIRAQAQRRQRQRQGGWQSARAGGPAGTQTGAVRSRRGGPALTQTQGRSLRAVQEDPQRARALPSHFSDDDSLLAESSVLYPDEHAISHAGQAHGHNAALLGGAFADPIAEAHDGGAAPDEEAEAAGPAAAGRRGGATGAAGGADNARALIQHVGSIL